MMRKDWVETDDVPPVAVYMQESIDEYYIIHEYLDMKPRLANMCKDTWTLLVISLGRLSGAIRMDLRKTWPESDL